MLQNIRQHATGWISGILVALISLAFALWGVQNYITGAKRAKVVAKVNSHKITEVELKLQYQRMKQQLAAQYGTDITINENMQKMLRRQALNQLINQEVITQSALKSGFTISPDQLLYVIHQMPTFQFDGKFSYQRFRQIIGNMGYSEESFLEEMDHNLLYGQLRSGIEASAFALSNEIEQAILLSKQQRDFQYAVIEKKTFEDKVKLNEDTIKNYYEQNKKEFETPEKVRLEYIMLSADKIKDSISVDDDDVKKYYEVNPVLSMTQKEWSVDEVIVPVALDADQAQVAQAKALIDEVKSQANNGNEIKDIFEKIKAKNKDVRFESDTFKAGSRDSNVVKYIAKLKENEYSEPFRTEKGYHLVKIKSIKEPTQLTFAKVKDRLKEGLIKQKVEQAFVSQSDDLSELAYTNPDSLQPVVDALKLPIQETELFGRDGLDGGIESNPKILQVAFSDDLLEGGNNSQPIELGPGKVIVFRIKEHIPPKILALEKVRDQIVAKLKHQEAEQKAEELSKQIVAALRKGNDPKKLASKYDFTWLEGKDVSRSSKGIDREVTALAFSLPDPKAIKKKPTDSARLASGDYAIVQLVAIRHKGSSKISDEERKTIDEALRTGNGRLEFDLLVKSLMNRANIKILGN